MSNLTAVTDSIAQKCAKHPDLSGQSNCLRLELSNLRTSGLSKSELSRVETRVKRILSTFNRFAKHNSKR
jgi:hypothetical protein